MELRHILYFATVAEQQFFTQAAKKLHVAQPAISQQIKALEEELGVKLLFRTKRSVKLTAAGRAFLRKAKEILNRVERSRFEARRAAQEESGKLFIGCVSWAAFGFLPELVHTFCKRYPGLRVHLQEQSYSQQLEALQLGSVDAGFTARLPQALTGNLEQELVYRDSIMVVLPEHHERRRCSPRSNNSWAPWR